MTTRENIHRMAEANKAFATLLGKTILHSTATEFTHTTWQFLFAFFFVELFRQLMRFVYLFNIGINLMAVDLEKFVI